MGDNFLKQQIRNFEKSTDDAMDELERPNLIRSLKIATIRYKAKPLKDETFVDGETLNAVVSKNGTGIILGRGHHRIGEVTGQSAESLREKMRDLGSILKVRVVGSSPVSQRATFEVLPE